ncbi:cbb3-type cytochrome c oxidase N-terminal domain-containing protein [Echinicola sediminis]
MAFLLVLFSQVGFAQETEKSLFRTLGAMESSELGLLLMIAVVLGVLVLLLILMVYLMFFINVLLKKENPEMAEAPSWWENFKERFVTGKLKPIEKEEEIMLEHSYDGIVELDNFMPPWLKYMFYGTLLFAVVYMVNNTSIGMGKSPEEEYQAQLDEEAISAEQRKALALASIDETNVVYDQSDLVLNAGGAIYQNNCVACHASDGGGGIGPNFTDEYWLHGGSIQDVFTVIKYGIPEKGMIPWQDQLSPEEIQQVANYVLSLKGTTPANPKEPQGEIYVPKDGALADEPEGNGSLTENS